MCGICLCVCRKDKCVHRCMEVRVASSYRTLLSDNPTPKVLELQTHATTPDFYMGDGIQMRSSCFRSRHGTDGAISLDLIQCILEIEIIIASM